MNTTTTPKRSLPYLKGLRADELSGLRHLPEGSPERRIAEQRIFDLTLEIQALRSKRSAEALAEIKARKG